MAAYNYAVRLLAVREYCAFELKAKMLARGHGEDCVEAVLTHLQDAGLQSEARFAESFLRARMRKGEAPWLAAQKARQKGVDESALQQALIDARSSFDALEACRELLSKRDPQGARREDERVWQRQARFLRNKGFDSATILRALNARDGQFDD